MGDFATYRGKELKIGTTEDLLYLRADQSDTHHTPQVDARDLAGPFPARRGVSPTSRDHLSRIERRRLLYLPI